MVFCCMAIRLSLRLTAFQKASTIFICARNFSSRPSKYFCIDAQPAASPPEKSACSDTLFLSVGRYFVDNPRPTTGKISACSRRYKEREELQVHAPTAKRLQQSRCQRHGGAAAQKYTHTKIVFFACILSDICSWGMKPTSQQIRVLHSIWGLDCLV